jgi:hypothetical protein
MFVLNQPEDVKYFKRRWDNLISELTFYSNHLYFMEGLLGVLVLNISDDEVNLKNVFNMTIA